MNRLAHERSPYLQQHAANPVDWYPWGEDAFAAARTSNRPIFLSIGYSTCHWCHVMAHESFENPDVAAVLNEHFVSIKVDREERPDVDRVYMTFVQATTGSGGWPMSVWLTPSLEPFFGGTYFPPSSRWGRPGFVEILGEIARVWRTERDKLVESAEAVTAQMRELSRAAAPGAPPAGSALQKAVAQFRDAFDPRYGGFGQAPKFPRSAELLFLLREFARTGDEQARAMAAQTLAAMALRGMRDHLGGGFHRYSVDAEWRVPHFEKMLYDQAQLVLANLEAAEATGDAYFSAVAEDTLQYVMREMTDESGGFYSAEDADSIPPEQAGRADAHASEGAFYLWREDEIRARLGEDADVFVRRFGVRPDGNAPADPQGEFRGLNILYVAESFADVARATNRSVEDAEAAIARGRVRLFEARLARPRPHLDDKVLTAWNGLMIAAFARAARVVPAFEAHERGAPYLDVARAAASFVRARLWSGDTRTLLRRYRQGEAGIEAYAEDYAYLIWGLLELFQSDGDVEWLDWAVALQDRQDELFWDAEAGGWFSTTGRDPAVLLRMKEDYDGAEPTASSVSVMNLIVLSHLVERTQWRERIDRTLSLFAPRLEQMGRAVPMMAAALSASVSGLQQIVIVEGAGREALEREVARRYLPFAIRIPIAADRQAALARRLPFVEGMRAIDGRATAYVCRNFACEQPVFDPAALAEMLDRRA